MQATVNLIRKFSLFNISVYRNFRLLLVDMKNRCFIDSVRNYATFNIEHFTQLRTESLRNADITQPLLKLINSDQSHEYKFSQL